VVLVVALILVVILSLLGALAVRNATQSERSINGIRSAHGAREAAETALRFCEQIAMWDGNEGAGAEYSGAGLRAQIISTPVITSEQDATAAWRSLPNWTSGQAITVPDDYTRPYADGGASAPLNTAPRCIIQKIQGAGTPPVQGYLITARGFGNGVVFDSHSGKTKYGAEAWLQSILTWN
jgi:Tfp pilus assembly protein PilX